MAKSREEFQVFLENILGSRHVYFQPPESVKMEYPAIVYSRSNIQNTFANNSVYVQNIAYEVVVIDKNPESKIVKKMSLIPFCHHNRNYQSENLNHDVFTIYF